VEFTHEKVIKMKIRRSLWLMPLAVIPFGLAACGDDDKPADTTQPSEIANPASEFCVAQGGTVEIVDEAGGQVGYCNLPDGTRVEEWEYFNANSATTTAP
jgi:putative hemolysin